MTTSAVERSPVEIWCNILELVIHSPLIPHQDATLAQSLAIFSTGCDFDLLLRQLTRVVSKLRLVCHSWNEIVQLVQPATVQCNFDTPYAEAIPLHIWNPRSDDAVLEQALQKMQRIDTWYYYRCECGNKCRSSVSKSELISTIRPISFTAPVKAPPFALQSTLNRLEVFNSRNYASSESPNDLLDRMPNLKVLGWAYGWFNFFSSTIMHPIHQKLTHLSLNINAEDIRRLETSVQFTALEILELSISPIPDSEFMSGDLNFSNWAIFPVLRMLSLQATVDPPQVEELVSFLAKVGLRLESLLVSIATEEDTGFFWFKPEMWAYFPSLVHFGPGVASLTSNIPPPPKERKPLTMVMSGDPLIQENQLAAVFMAACQIWHIQKIVLLCCWEQMKVKVRGMDYRVLPRGGLLYQSRFYRLLAESGVEVRDRDDVLITEPQGVCFLQTLKDSEATAAREAPNTRLYSYSHSLWSNISV